MKFLKIFLINVVLSALFSQNAFSADNYAPKVVEPKPFSLCSCVVGLLIPVSALIIGWQVPKNALINGPSCIKEICYKHHFEKRLPLESCRHWGYCIYSNYVRDTVHANAESKCLECSGDFLYNKYNWGNYPLAIPTPGEVKDRPKL